MCFVVNELYPFQKGGIGRWIYNTVRAAGSDDAWFAMLLYGPNFHALTDAEKAAIVKEFRSFADVFFLEDILDQSNSENHIDVNSRFDDFASESFYICNALRHLAVEDRIRFDFIEFIDFGGPGLFAAQAKKGEEWLAGTEVAIRLHSTNSLIVEHEIGHTAYSEWHSDLHDIERKALLDADLIIAHIPEIAAINRAYYRFPEDWAAKVVVNVPPVVLDPSETAMYHDAAFAVADDDDRPVFAFTARLAPFKRPDTFIDAAVLALDAGMRARFLLASYGWDGRYIALLRASVPERYRDDIVFLDDLPEPERLKAISRAVIVIPSIYESFCFLAFESLLRRQKLILNKECAAFGRNDFWADERNCLMFGGTAADLAAAMWRALDWSPSSFEIPDPTAPYWRTSPSSPGRNVGGGPRATLQIALLGAPRVEGMTTLMAGDAAKAMDIAVSAIDSRWQDGRAVRERFGQYDFVMFAAPGVVPDSGYLQFAANVLAQHPEIDGVVPQLFSPAGRMVAGFNGGDLVSMALTNPAKLGVIGAVLRGALLRDPSLWDDDGRHWLHSGTSRAVLRGRRFVASPRYGCYIFNMRADPILDAEMASGIYKRHLAEYAGKFGAVPVRMTFYQPVDERSLHADLRGRLDAAEKLARERYAAIQEMENMISARDRHIGADAKLLHERYEAIVAMGATIDEQSAQLASAQAQLEELRQQVQSVERESSARKGLFGILSR